MVRWPSQNILKNKFKDFPGAVIKNLLANARVTGSIPGLGRFHIHGTTKPMCHNYGALEPQLRALTPEPLKPGTLEPAFCNQKPPQ